MILFHESCCALAFVIWLYLSFPSWEPAARTLSSLYPIAQSVTAASQTCSWSFSSSIESSQISKGLLSEWRQALTTVYSRTTQLSKLGDQPGCVRKYMFHITTISPFSFTLISETDTQINQSSWKRNLFFHLSLLIVQFLICLAISWQFL